MTSIVALGTLGWLAWDSGARKQTDDGASRERQVAERFLDTCTLAIVEVTHEGGTRYLARGIAKVPEGYHVWLLSHGEETERWWIPVPEFAPDSASGAWSARVYHDGWHQRGDTFALALVGVTGGEQAAFVAEWQRTQRNEENPVALPRRGCRPEVRTVIAGVGAPSRDGHVPR